MNGFVNTALDNTLITINQDFRVFGVPLQSLDEIAFHIIPNYDRPVTDFNIYRGTRLRRGTVYNFVRYSFRLNTTQRRQVISGVSVRPRPGVIVQLEDEWNKVALKEGHFTTNLERLTFNYQIGPWVSFANVVQFDTISHVLGWQPRFRWIMKPGNDLYVVYTHNWIDQFHSLQTLDRGLATKVTFTKRF